MIDFVILAQQSNERVTESFTYNLLKDFSLPLLAMIWAVYSFLRQNRRKLSIRQVGDSRLDKIVQLDDHRVAFCMEMVITNDSPSATIVIAYYDLLLPWNEPELEPLNDPQDLYPSSDRYETPGLRFKPHREQVLNHRRYQFGKLAPGDAIRGHFLATGRNRIPGDLISSERHAHIDATFLVEDTTGKKYRSKRPVELYL